MTRAFGSLAVGSVFLAATLAGWEAFAPHSHPVGEVAHEDDSIGEYLVVLGIIGAGALVVFGWVVRRGLRRESAAWTALALSLASLLSVAIFWSGLPPILAGGAILLGWMSRDEVRARWAARAAVAVGALALVADVVLYATGA